jgi:antitoxin Phd
MARTWLLEEAKNKLGEMIEEAIQHGPQIISRQGTDIAVILSYEEYLVLKGNRANLAQFFLESPLRGSGLDLRRDRSEGTKFE